MEMEVQALQTNNIKFIMSTKKHTIEKQIVKEKMKTELKQKKIIKQKELNFEKNLIKKDDLSSFLFLIMAGNVNKNASQKETGNIIDTTA
jgi:hypothetical protein